MDNTIPSVKRLDYGELESKLMLSPRKRQDSGMIKRKSQIMLTEKKSSLHFSCMSSEKSEDYQPSDNKNCKIMQEKYENFDPKLLNPEIDCAKNKSSFDKHYSFIPDDC